MSSESKRLTVHTASVATASVEIKTLTVSGKQVTLAVFRQLIEEPILDALTAEITGDPWGTVNYHPDKCTDNPEHLHVVWQKGTELRRATVQAPEAGFHKHPAADLDWFKLPVKNSRFPEFAQALDWTPSPMQPTCPLRSILASRNRIGPRRSTR